MRHVFLKKAVVGLGGLSLLRKLNKTPRVLFYHGVDQIIDSSVQTLHLSPEIFKEEMQYLKKYYEVISMDEFCKRFASSSFSGNEVVVTFDDGYRNNLVVAAPILDSLSIPFTVFVSVNHLENGSRFPTFINRAVVQNKQLTHIRIESLGIDCDMLSDADRFMVMKHINNVLKNSDVIKVKLICSQLEMNLTADSLGKLYENFFSDAPMDWGELAKLNLNYDCIIGSHCLDHFICNSYQQAGETRRQILESKHILEEKLGVECRYLAFPNGNVSQGDISEVAKMAVEEAGYKLAFTTMNERLRRNSDPFLLPRCAARFDLLDFQTKLALKPGF